MRPFEGVVGEGRKGKEEKGRKKRANSSEGRAHG